MSDAKETLRKYEKEYPAGHVLFREGEVGKEMYVILSGKVTISKEVRGQEQILVTLPPGEFFGEMSILNNKPRSATATIAEKCKVLMIDPKTFEEMVKNNTEIAVRMIKKLAGRLADADAQIENLMFKDLNSRIVHFLASHAESAGKKVDGGIKVEISVEELSKRVGSEVDVVNNVLNKLVKGNIVQIVPDGLMIANIDQLRKFLEFLAMKEKFGEMAG
jgi:CRP-like cAMP-binding protein